TSSAVSRAVRNIASVSASASPRRRRNSSSVRLRSTRKLASVSARASGVFLSFSLGIVMTEANLVVRHHLVVRVAQTTPAAPSNPSAPAGAYGTHRIWTGLLPRPLDHERDDSAGGVESGARLRRDVQEIVDA